MPARLGCQFGTCQFENLKNLKIRGCGDVEIWEFGNLRIWGFGN
jgi:hypothetical protein